jgi:hypothetical protein
MSIFDTFETDPKAEAEGKWFEFPANKDGTVPRVKLARMARTNPRYVASLEHYSKLYKVELAHDLMDSAKGEAPFRAVFCDTILLAWENMQDKQGKDIDFKDRDALLVKLPAFYDVLRAYATELQAFKATEADTVAGE